MSTEQRPAGTRRPNRVPGGFRKHDTGFLAGFAIAAVLLAAGLSYLADSSPDGLEAVTHKGCTTVSTPQGERLKGQCIAQTSSEHAFGDGPLAGYTLFGNAGLTGLAGLIGVVVTAAVAVGLFWLVRRRGNPSAGREE